MSKPTVAVIGASKDRSKFGNKSVRAHQLQGYDVYPVNPKEVEIEGLQAYKSLADVPVDNLDRISIYVPPAVGLTLLDEIKAKGAREVWFNPGSDGPEVVAKARAMSLNVIQACSIVDVGISPRQLADA